MSIRLRFTFALTAVGILLFGSYAWWSFRSERDDLRSAAIAEIRIIGQALVTSVGNALRDEQRADIEETLTTLEALAPNLDIHIHDVVGARLALSRGANPERDLEQLVKETAISGVEHVLFEPENHPDRLIFTGPLTEGDTVIGAIAIARPTDDLHEDLARTRDRLVVALLVFSIATIIAGLFLGTIHVTRPISLLLEGVRQVRVGDFRKAVKVGRSDEIGELVVEFNAMIQALAEYRARSEAETEARARLEIGLQRVDKLVTIGQLSAGLAHEIGSPLQVLSGRAQALLEHADPEVRRQATILVAQGDRITRVVEQLLSFGRRKPAAVGRCKLSEPVSSVLEMMEPEARRRGVRLELETTNDPCEIVGDVDQLQQVALNLVRNALTVTPRGGVVKVRVDRVRDVVRLSVKDTGCGIDRETQARLFEPFFTTRASDGGTGLGLAVVRAIVDEHHAKIDFVSEPGAGAEFTVSFPSGKESDRA
jgi:signal transduction histidine kinase